MIQIYVDYNTIVKEGQLISITSPIDGIVISKDVEEKQTVASRSRRSSPLPLT